MRIASLAALCLASLPALHAAEISWNVRAAQTFAEGVAVQRVAFTDGEKNYALSLDDETTASVAGAGTRFTFKGLSSALFEIQPSPVTPPLPFTPEKIEKYRAAAKLRAQVGTETLANVEESLEPLAINGWASYRLAFSFSQHGKRVRKCVTFLTVQNGQQALLETSAYEAEFKAAFARSEYLIRSWHELGLKITTPDS